MIALPKLNDEIWKAYNNAGFAGSGHVRALLGWFEVYGIYIGKLYNNEEREMTYNSLYHFYKWSLFFFTKERKDKINRIADFLRSKGYRVETHSTWCNVHKDDYTLHCGGGDNAVQIHGIEFWIYPIA